MRIAIVTVYQPFANLGSFLQAYALSEYLKGNGHEVKFITTSHHLQSAFRIVRHLRPWRSYFHRWSLVYHALADLKMLDFASEKTLADDEFDLCIMGSDEIWNVTNGFFRRPVFWGGSNGSIPAIAYAVSVGHAQENDFIRYSSLTRNIVDFETIFTRDAHTANLISRRFGIETDRVIDPTLLWDVNKLTRPIKPLKRPYILVYTYGIDKPIIDILVKFARTRNLEIVSSYFWHSWADRVIACSALQLSSLMSGASFVFTTTFHGAVFALINHTRCAILPLREKVADLCNSLYANDRLLNVGSCTYQDFESTICRPFRDKEFENRLRTLRAESQRLLDNEIAKFAR